MDIRAVMEIFPLLDCFIIRFKMKLKALCQVFWFMESTLVNIKVRLLENVLPQEVHKCGLEIKLVLFERYHVNINNVYFDNVVRQIYLSELQLNKANTSDTEAAFLDLLLSISNDIVSTKIYDKRDVFDFEIINFPFLDGDAPRSSSYGAYISQLIRFARASSYVTDCNTRNKLLTQKLLKKGYWYHKLRKAFSKFSRQYCDLISKFQVRLKSLLPKGLSQPEFYGDLVYKLKQIVGSNNFQRSLLK